MRAQKMLIVAFSYLTSSHPYVYSIPVNILKKANRDQSAQIYSVIYILLVSQFVFIKTKQEKNKNQIVVV